MKNEVVCANIFFINVLFSSEDKVVVLLVPEVLTQEIDRVGGYMRFVFRHDDNGLDLERFAVVVFRTSEVEAEIVRSFVEHIRAVLRL